MLNILERTKIISRRKECARLLHRIVQLRIIPLICWIPLTFSRVQLKILFVNSLYEFFNFDSRRAVLKGPTFLI